MAKTNVLLNGWKIILDKKKAKISRCHKGFQGQQEVQVKAFIMIISQALKKAFSFQVVNWNPVISEALHNKIQIAINEKSKRLQFLAGNSFHFRPFVFRQGFRKVGKLFYFSAFFFSLYFHSLDNITPYLANAIQMTLVQVFAK